MIFTELAPVLLEKINPVYDWKSKMRLKLKKLIPVFLTFTFLSSLSMIPANALTNGYYFCNTGLPSNLTSAEISIHVLSNVAVEIGDSCSGALVIPNGVTSIGNRAFISNPNITSVDIPNSVTSIGSEAFKDNTSLASVTFGNSVTSIGTYAFYNNALTSVSIPNSVTTIGDQAFQQNTSLTSVTLGNSVSSIGTYSFSTESLTSVTFLGNAPATVSNVAFYKFGADATANVLYNATGFPADGSRWNRLTIQRIANCSTSGYFTIVNNVVTGNTDCDGLVNIPNGVTRIANDAFYETLIDSVNIPNTVTQIGDAAFYNTSLVSVTIPDSVTIIGEYAFSIETLTSVTFGNGLTTIGNFAFSGTNLSSVTFPNSVTTIRLGAFSGINSLLSVNFGNRLQTIGTYAFKETGLSEVTIPNSVTTIGEDAFAAVTSLTSVNIGNSVTQIGFGAFRFTSLSSVTIPSSVTDILLGAFENVTTLSSVTFLGNAPNTATDAFSNVGIGAKANVAYNATGFPANGSTWNGLIVSYGSAPAGDSDSTTATVITPKVVKTADVVFNLKNKKYLSKNALKARLSKNKSFKRVPEDLYKYSIFNASKKTCVINENYVTGLKKTGTCNLYATRTTTKGVKYKYWVQINYTK
jgi:hypothetical protein